MAIKTEFIISAQDDTKRAVDSASDGLRQIGEEAREFANVAVTAFAAAAAGAAAFAAAAIAGSLESAKELSNFSRVAGTSVETFQRMAFGAKSVGIEQEKLADILKDTQDKIGEFLSVGGGPAIDFFEQIAPKVGVTAEQFRGLSGPDALQLYVSSLEKANLTQAEMTFYMEALASDSSALIPLLKDGGQAMAAQAREADALGLVLTKLDVAKMTEAQQSISRTKEAFGGFADQLGAQFAPIITAISAEMLEAVKQAGGFGQIASEVFQGVIQGAAYTANVIHGLVVVWDGIKVAIVSAAEIALRFFEGIETGYRTVANLIPGIEVSTESAIGNVRQSFTNVREDFVSGFQQSLNEPMPYDGIVKWAEEATRAATERAAQVAIATTGAASQNAAALASGGSGDPAKSLRQEDDKAIGYMEFDPSVDPEVILAQERIAYLRTLKDAQLATDVESEELAYLNRMEMLRARFEEGELPTLESYNRLKEGVEAQHQANLTNITDKAAAARAAFDKKTRTEQTKQVFGELANLTAGVASHNKGMFELNKAAGIANAIINTYTGVTQSLAAYPMPLAAVMAAAHLASGLAQVSAIKSQSFGSTSGSATAVGVAPITNAPSNISLSPTSSETAAAAVEKKPDVYINIEPAANYSGSQLRDLMERLAEEQNFNVRFGS